MNNKSDEDQALVYQDVSDDDQKLDQIMEDDLNQNSDGESQDYDSEGDEEIQEHDILKKQKVDDLADDDSYGDENMMEIAIFMILSFRFRNFCAPNARESTCAPKMFSIIDSLKDTNDFYTLNHKIISWNSLWNSKAVHCAYMGVYA